MLMDMSTPSPSFGTILVPLDGSTLAERSLPFAKTIALATNSALLLARVIPPFEWGFGFPGEYMDPEAMQNMTDTATTSAQAYLAKVAAPLQDRGNIVQTAALFGEPIPTLLDVIDRQKDIGMMIMASHGRTGLARFALGSVTERMARLTPVPLLVLRSFGQDQEAPQSLFGRICLPLDGSQRAEQVIPFVVKLAQTMTHAIEMIHVVSATATSETIDKATEYLETMKARLRDMLGTTPCRISAALLHGDVAQQLVEHAHIPADCIVLTNRGQSGHTRWFLGSIADRVLQGATVPTVLVPVT
jgi:nucleotide-binding universal stress UspA family protein